MIYHSDKSFLLDIHYHKMHTFDCCFRTKHFFTFQIMFSEVNIYVIIVSDILNKLGERNYYIFHLHIYVPTEYILINFG